MLKTALRSRWSLAGLLAAAALVAPSAATAASTTVNTAGHTIGLGNGSVNLMLWNGALAGAENCTISGGSGTIPAGPGHFNPSGPVVVTLATRPTFSSCTNGPFHYTVTTSGTWSLSFQGGTTPTATLNIPAGGLSANFQEFSCPATNNTAIAVTGTWQNGFTTPTFTPSKFTGGGSYYTNTACTGNGWLTSVRSGVFPVLDLTSPSALVTVS